MSTAQLWNEDTARWARDRVLQHLPNLPEHMRHGVMTYLDHGGPVGGFLTALFEGDLSEAVLRADPLNTHAWPQWLRLVEEHMPVRSCGSKAKAAAWREQRGLEAYAAKPPAAVPEDGWRDVPMTFGDLWEVLARSDLAHNAFLMNVAEAIGRRRARGKEAGS